jgi:hypothetical protein
MVFTTAGGALAGKKRIVRAEPVARIFFTAIKEPPAFRSASGEGFVGRVRVTSLLV